MLLIARVCKGCQQPVLSAVRERKKMMTTKTIEMRSKP
jgi:hypothetical protein